jgi:parallel beta-helix repeat protein
MKIKLFPLVCALVFLSIISQLSTAFAQGSLAPTGAPAPTMKSLSQVEPRTPVSQANVPFSINAPGSYFLTENLGATVNGQIGIVVNVPDVTLDLSGFRIGNSEVATFAHGIFIAANSRAVQIRNGVISGCSSNGIGTATGVGGCQFSDLRLTGNGGDGLFGGHSALVERCTALNNVGNGITVLSNSTVNACISNRNGRDGIEADNGCTVNDCTTATNGVSGISVESGCTVSGCTSSRNDNSGISADIDCTISDCTATHNGVFGINGGSESLVTRSVANRNSSTGIRGGNGSTIHQCTAAANDFAGVSVALNCIVAENTVKFSPNGILVSQNGNLIDGNRISGNAVGIRVTLTNNVIIRNVAHHNDTNYLFPGSLHLYGPTNSLSGEINSSNPWRNISD